MKIQSTYLYAEVLSFWSWEKWGPLKKNVGKWIFATLLCGLKLRHPLPLCHYFTLLVEPLTYPKKKKVYPFLSYGIFSIFSHYSQIWKKLLAGTPCPTDKVGHEVSLTWPLAFYFTTQSVSFIKKNLYFDPLCWRNLTFCFI